MKYLIILALLISPLAYAHHPDNDDAPVPTTGNQDNHNNSEDNRKHLLEAAVLTGLVIWWINRNDNEQTRIHFSPHQGPSSAPGGR